MQRQARQESNPQPPVLETGALPIELLAFIRLWGPGKGSCQSPALTTYHTTKLFRLTMDRMAAAAVAELFQLHAPGVVATVLLSRVIPFFALGASQCDHRTDAFLFRCHNSSHFSQRIWLKLLPTKTYLRIFVITPEATVRPPSRIANFEPCSKATGTISSASILMLSPGITISTPSGRSIEPVTSIVRM